LPDTLDGTYDRTLEEIGKQNWEYAHRLFQCVAVASRPLRVEEVAEFLAFDFDTDSTPTFREDWREEDPAHAVRSTCSTLLAIVDVDGYSVIQFAHFSVKEYLTSKRVTESQETISRFHISTTLAHTIIAQACLSVLLHIDENVTKEDLKKFPLVQYAAEHLGEHARFEGVLPKIQDGITRLFDPSNRHFPIWVWIYHPEHGHGAISDQLERPSQALATPLHYAAFYGLHDVVKFLIVERSQDVNTRDFYRDETPLSVASRRGSPEVARVLLEHGADTETRDDEDYSPLERSSGNGHVEVLQVLLEHGADPNFLDQYNWTALHLASGSGEVAAARLLLENGADANAKKTDNETPLHLASNEGVTRVLLEYGADPTARDSDNRTPLHGALRMNYAEVARVLLENGVDANARDAKNRTPLHVAIKYRYPDGVRLLLQHGVNIHAQDGEGRTPFHVASQYLGPKRDIIMQLLLEHGAEDYRTQ
jgi:ankyrin repeat protein